MEAVKLAGFSIAAALLAMTVRRQQPQIGLCIAIGAGVLILGLAVQRLSGVAETIAQLCSQAQLQGDALKMLLKVLGISYLTEFAAQTCRDAGEEGLCQKVLLAGRVMVLALAAPVAVALVGLILELAP